MGQKVWKTTRRYACEPPGLGTTPDMGEYSTVGIWTRCPDCTDEAVAVVQFWGRGDDRARLVDFRCPAGCPVETDAVLRRLRLTALDRAS